MASTSQTLLLCPSRTPSHRPVFVFQSRTVLSLLPETSFPSFFADESNRFDVFTMPAHRVCYRIGDNEACIVVQKTRDDRRLFRVVPRELDLISHGLMQHCKQPMRRNIRIPAQRRSLTRANLKPYYLSACHPPSFRPLRDSNPTRLFPRYHPNLHHYPQPSTTTTQANPPPSPSNPVPTSPRTP